MAVHEPKTKHVFCAQNTFISEKHFIIFKVVYVLYIRSYYNLRAFFDIQINSYFKRFI